MTGVRLRPEGFEGKCDACHEWWPLERAFWQPNSGLRRCAACVIERRPVREIPPEVLEARRAYNREWMRRYRAAQRRSGMRRAA